MTPPNARFTTVFHALVSALTLFAIITTALTSFAEAAPQKITGTVELHAHLLMKEGLRWWFTGKFEDELCADDWSDRFSSQANPQTLAESGNAITVLALYAHPILTGFDVVTSIRNQLAEAHAFVARDSRFVIARSPSEARTALQQGKKVIVLGLEGAYGIVDRPELIDEFVVKGGVRIVTLLHLTDDDLGGGAFLAGLNSLGNPSAFLSHFWRKKRDPDGVWLNPLGLTDQGEKVMRDLMSRGVWIDLSHATDAAHAQMVPLLREAGQPLLYTHTSLRKHHHAERGISHEQLAGVASTQGMLGLMPSEDMLSGTEVETRFCPPGCGPCRGGLFALAQQYTEASAVTGAHRVVFGSDFNGGVRHLPPPSMNCVAANGQLAASPLSENGFFHIGQTPAVWSAIQDLGAAVPPVESGATVEAFLSAWSQVSDRASK